MPPLNTDTDELIGATAGDMAADPLRGEVAAARAFPSKKESTKRLQTTFSNHFRSLTEPVKHDATSVLLLSWEKKYDDMDVSDEIEQLTRVFKDEYHFKVEHTQLKESEKIQLDLTYRVTKFVWENEGPHNLCIIYYAGHGFGGDNPGELNLVSSSNQESRGEDQRQRNTVAWHAAEHNLKKIAADVLVIFDCCYAGALQTHYRAAQHSFEFLGACDYDQLTPGPGEQSFTSALIKALSQLKNSTGFDSAALKEKIMDSLSSSSDLRSPPQKPVLFPREYPNEDHVWIAPSRSSGNSTPVSPSILPVHYREDGPKEWLDLRFRFSKVQDENRVEQLAKMLNRFVRDNGSELGIRGIELRGHVTPATLLRDTAQYWGGLRKEVKQKARLIVDDQVEEDRDGPPPSLPVALPYDLAGIPGTEGISNSRPEPELSNLRVRVLQVDEIDDRAKFPTQNIAAVGMKAFVAGILLSLFFWYQFFFVSYTRILWLWEIWVKDSLPGMSRSLMFGGNGTR